MTRIPQCEVTNNDFIATTGQTTTTTNNKKTQPATTASTFQRHLFGKDNDQWVATTFSDFNTLMFEPLVQMFHKTVADTNSTALLVNRMISIATSPSAYRLSAGAMRVLQEDNAGGASEFSEAISFEIMHRLFDCQLLKTEMSIAYRYGPWSRKTDYTCLMRGEAVAVSVTRAMRFAGTFTQQDAFNLLYKKLYGCQMSNRDVLAGDRWTKQILHILCAHQYIVEILRAVYAFIYEHTPELIGNTVVLITLTDGAPFLYFNFCRAQAEMKFETDAAAALADATVFTTPAALEESKSLRFGAAAGESKSEFFFGYRTREDALVHDAIVTLQPCEVEGEVEPYDLWADEELGDKEAGGLFGAIAGLLEVDEEMGVFGTMAQAAAFATSSDREADAAESNHGAGCGGNNNKEAPVSVADRIASLKAELAVSWREARRRRVELDLIGVLTAKISQLIAAGMHGEPNKNQESKPAPRQFEQIFSAQPAASAAAAAAARGGDYGAMTGASSHPHPHPPLLTSPPIPTSLYARRQHQLCARKYPCAGEVHPQLSLAQLQRLFTAACAKRGWIEQQMIRGGSCTTDSPTALLTAGFQRYDAIKSPALALPSADDDDEQQPSIFDEPDESVAQCA